MSEIISVHCETLHPRGLLPVRPRVEVLVRLAVDADFAFIDALQKAESDKVGFMYEQAIRKRMADGDLLISEVVDAESQQTEAVGYCMGLDKYQKRGDLGIIYQMAVLKSTVGRWWRRRCCKPSLISRRMGRSFIAVGVNNRCKQIDSGKPWGLCRWRFVRVGVVARKGMRRRCMFFGRNVFAKATRKRRGGIRMKRRVVR